jgi:HSP20 family protein
MTDATAIPLNIYENERELLVSTPMPGIGPEDVEVEVGEDRRVTFRARQHGEGQERIDYLVREWAYGPYERTADLPRDVDAPRANLSLGNGVLVVTFPKADRTVPGRLRIDRHGMARGMTAGHAGTRGGAPAD